MGAVKLNNLNIKISLKIPNRRLIYFHYFFTQRKLQIHHNANNIFIKLQVHIFIITALEI